MTVFMAEYTCVKCKKKKYIGSEGELPSNEIPIMEDCRECGTIMQIKTLWDKAPQKE